MSSSCIEDLISVIISEIVFTLGPPALKSTDRAPSISQVKTSISLNAFCNKGSLGLGEPYGRLVECERLDMFFQRVVSAGCEETSPPPERYPAYAAARLTNLQKRARIVGKEHYDLGNDLFTPDARSLHAIFLRLLERRYYAGGSAGSQADDLRKTAAATGHAPAGYRLWPLPPMRRSMACRWSA